MNQKVQTEMLYRLIKHEEISPLTRCFVFCAFPIQSTDSELTQPSHAFFYSHVPIQISETSPAAPVALSQLDSGVKS